MKSIISKQSREKLEKEFPRVFCNPDYIKLFGYINTQAIPDYKTGEITLFADFKTIKSLLGITDNFNVGKFLESFENDTGIKLNVSNYSFDLESKTGKVRTLIPELPEWVNDLFYSENVKYSQENEPVYFDTGEIYNKKKHNKSLKEDFKPVSYEKNRISSITMNYMKRHIKPAHYINRKERILDLFEMVENNSKWDKKTKDLMVKALNNVYMNPIPMFVQNSSTERIHTLGHSFMTLPSEYRMYILQDCISFDLSQAQLRINCGLWKVKSILEILNSGVSFWDKILGDLQLTAESKDTIKKAIYATCYGSTLEGNLYLNKEGIKGIFLNGGIIEAFIKFIELPYIKELLEVRELKLKEMERITGYLFPNGNYVKLSGKPRQKLARLSQDIEQFIMSGVYEEAEYLQSELEIILPMHDGFEAVVKVDNKLNEIKDKLEIALNKKASMLGLEMFLEIKS